MLIFNIIDGHLKLNCHYFLKLKNTIMTSSLMFKYEVFVSILDESIIVISPFVAITYKINK